MTPVQKLKLNNVLSNNKDWPLVIIGATSADFKNATIVPATLSARDLATLNFEVKPTLIIDGLDKVNENVQENFITLFKDRGGMSKDLPTGTQIIIPVASKEKLSRKILDLALIWEL